MLYDILYNEWISWSRGASIGWHSDDNRPYLKQRHFSVSVILQFNRFWILNSCYLMISCWHSAFIFLLVIQWKVVCYLNTCGKDFNGGLFHFQDGEPATIMPASGVSFILWWFPPCFFNVTKSTLAFLWMIDGRLCFVNFNSELYDVFGCNYSFYPFKLVNGWFSNLFSFSGCCDVHSWRQEHSFRWWGINQTHPFLSCIYLVATSMLKFVWLFFKHSKRMIYDLTNPRDTW